MDYKVHLATGALISLILVNFIGYNSFITSNIIIHMLILLFSILPDVDIHNSKVGKAFGMFSRLIQMIFGHRGFFHSIWIIILFYILLLPFGYEVAVLGYMGHLVVDMITKEGVKLLYPGLHIKGILPTNILVNLVFFFLIAFVDCILVLNLFYGFW